MALKREFTFLEVEGISREYEQLRLGVLSRILDGNYTAIIASVGAAIQLTMPPAALKERSFTIKTGDSVNLEELSSRLIKAGYTRFDQVDGTSQFAIRGGLIDIFSPGETYPVRIELWGDEVDSIAAFDVSTQRRGEIVKSIEIIPSTEVLFESKEKQAKAIEALASSLKGKATKAREHLLNDCDKLRQDISLRCSDKYLPLAYESKGLFDYFEGMLFICESARVKEKCNSQNKLMNEELKWLLDDGVICKGIDKFMLDFGELSNIYEKSNAIYFDSLPRGSFDTPVRNLSSFKSQTINPWSGTFSQLKDEYLPLLKSGYTIALMAGTSRAGKALEYDLSEAGFDGVFFEKRPKELKKGAVNVLCGSFDSGFQLNEQKFLLLTHTKTNQSKKKHKHFSSKDALRSIDELSKGDYIVHNIHGIGIFDGIQTLDINDIKKDYIKITYAKGDALYVPVTQLDLVSKYIGPQDNGKVKVNRLGSGDWKKSKAVFVQALRISQRSLSSFMQSV